MYRTVVKQNSNKDVEKALTFIKAQSQSKQICDTTRGTVFVGKGTLTEKELKYAIQCAKETQDSKTW